MRKTSREIPSPQGTIAESPNSYLRNQLSADNKTTVTFPIKCCQASLNSRIRESPMKSVKPAAIATTAITRATPSSQKDTLLKKGFPVLQKTTSQIGTATRNEAGNATNMG